MRINHNLNALNAWRQLESANNAMGKSLEKLSSGLRINRAVDDAAGLSISEKMRAQIKGLDMAVKNAQDSISLIQTAEGTLTETHATLQRMRELAVQAANDTNVTEDREALQDEAKQLRDEITRIANNTEFDTQKLLNGSFSDKYFHIGANISQNITLSINTMDASALGINSINLESQASANAAISTINAAIEEVSTERSKLGAYQNRLEHTINNLQVSSENLTAAESRIRDVDMAKEMMNYTKQQILLQSSNAMLAQANMVPQNVLQLLR
ncbi:flagellin [Petrotoga mexicana DSM 14811]|uniref:Flagellin n=1 Tax=Petrotoga mexicana DSM 14811 TaxID=1122954 RepID=A0A2K1PCE0_9BACT|nr:flagellin [Petrotoga mexicana]PNS00481.1 flagellin [Petrotoga mexicana DSM 14811]